jgi:hypothetical protein
MRAHFELIVEDVHAIHVIRRGPVSKRRSAYAAISWNGIAI